MRQLKVVKQIDLDILLWSERAHYYPSLVFLARSISRTGDGYLQILFPLLLWLVLSKVGIDYVYSFLLAFALERLIYFFLKNTLKRPRPPEAIPSFKSVIKASDHFSFPSGHTMAAFLLAGLATLTVTEGIISLYFYAWASMVGISRVILGVHFPTDIIAGAVLGTLISLVSVQLFF